MRLWGPVLVLSASIMLSACPLEAKAPSAAEKTERLLRTAMQEQFIPGLQIAVVKNGRLVLSKSYGTANLQAPIAVTHNSVFAINSITKAFTGVAALQMVEQGKLDPNAAISVYLDDLPDSWRPITIRQLLSHMSGLPDYTANAAPKDDDAAFEWAKKQPLHFPTGERYEYCQTNYALIQLAINKLNGRPAQTPLATAQFEAAGMTHTRYGDSHDVILHRAESYGAEFSKQPPVLHPRYEVFSPLHHSSSGINSTAEDMARWMIAVLNHRFLTAPSLETMWTPTRFNNGKVGQWGLGWMIGTDSAHPSVGMTGGSRAAMRLYPKDGVGIVILTNLAGAGPEDLIDDIASFYIPGFHFTGVAALRAELQQHGFDKAPQIAQRLSKAPLSEQPNEDALNDWAYRLLATGRQKDALPVFELAAVLYPASSNAFDSLGDAYQRTGNRTRAIEAYEKVLALDPTNSNAVKQLEKLHQP